MCSLFHCLCFLAVGLRNDDERLSASVLWPLGNDLGEIKEYDPNLLDDPQWPCGKHKRVLIFPSYMVSLGTDWGTTTPHLIHDIPRVACLNRRER